MSCTVIKFPQGVTEITGDIDAKPSGLNSGRMTKVTLSSGVWTALPATPLTGRNQLNILNNSGNTIRIEFDNTKATTEGLPILNDEERQYQIKGVAIIYGTADSSSTIIAEELA